MQLTQHQELPTEAQFNAIPQWIVILPTEFSQLMMPDLPYFSVFKQRFARRQRNQEKPLWLELPNEAVTLVSFGVLKSGCSTFECLTLARQLFAGHKDYQPDKIGVCIARFDDREREQIAEAVLAAILAAMAELPCFKEDALPTPELPSIELFGVNTAHGFKRTAASAAGNNLARYLAMLPGNQLTPGLYRRHIEKLVQQYAWKMEFYDVNALRMRHAGAFLAVCQGSTHQDAGIVHLRYQPRPGGVPKKTVALVGKGICFDTGGLHLKTRKTMLNMHQDMQGSGTALGVLVALTELEVDFAVDCWLALAENHISGNAFKPHDILRTSNELTIEVMDTDAEGRLVLADTLVLACREKPDFLMDYATLTGACVTALGSRYSGVLTNRAHLLPSLVDAGAQSGERVWGFPWDSDYDEELHSEVADIKQCRLEGEADHIYAMRFLSRFVNPQIPWVHVDLACFQHAGGLAHIPTDTIGFGVRFSLATLLDAEI